MGMISPCKEHSPAPETRRVPLDWQNVRVHVGRHRGALLGDLPPSSVRRLIEYWLPEYRDKAAEDVLLAEALEAAREVLKEADEYLKNEY